MRKILLTIIVLTLLMLAAVLLNIPILREIMAFIYLSFVPGFLILKILKLGKTNLVDTLLFSTGLSFVFLMFVGLLINGSYLFGVSRPLSTVPLVLGFSLSTTILLIVCYRRNLVDDFVSFRVPLKVTNVFFFRCSILVLPPVLGVLGALFLNATISMILIALIAVLFALSILSKKLIPSEFYPLLIFSVSLALLFHVVFTSKYILGFDANLEFYVFKLTQINGHWDFLNMATSSIGWANYAAMLSITLLPVIYSAMTNLSGEIVFKILYPMIFSLVIVVLYRIYESQIGKLASLASVLFFVSSFIVFYGFTPISLDRQIVATFFLVFSIFILFEKRISTGNRKLLLIFFGVAIAVSHYSIAFIYLGLLFFVFFVSKVKNKYGQVLNVRMILLISAIVFLWYSLAQSPIVTLAQFVQGLISTFSADFLNEASRTGGSSLSQPVANIGSFSTNLTLGVFYITHFFIAIGIIMLILNPKKTVFDLKYRSIAVLSGTIMVLSFLVPGFAPSLSMDRFYAITLLFLAPLFVMGFSDIFDLGKTVWFKTIGRRFFKKRIVGLRPLLLTILIISFLLTQSGFINRAMGNSPLMRAVDIDRVITTNNRLWELQFYDVYLPEQDVSSAIWLSKHNEAELVVYGDLITATHVLTSYYSPPSPEKLYYLGEAPIPQQNALIYLGTLNVVHHIVRLAEHPSVPTNISVLSGALNQISLIYNNGNSQVWEFDFTK
jgi:uncharacterized membrane protein